MDEKPVSGLRLWFPLAAVIGIVSVVIVASYGLAVRDADVSVIKEAIVLLRENQRDITNMVKDNIKAQVALQRIVDRLGYRVESLEERLKGKPP